MSSTTVGFPENLAYDPNNDRLFVGDDTENRFLLFDVSDGIANGMPASSILGKTDFTTGGSCTSPTQVSVCDPEIGMAYDTGDNRLWMTGDNNNRVLAWDFVKITTSSLPSGTVGTSYNQTLAASQNQGTLSWSVSAGSLPPGLSLSSSGIISARPPAPARPTSP